MCPPTDWRSTVPHYDGVITIEGDNFPVTVELEDELIRLSSSGNEIGQWHVADCKITRIDDETFTITAEGEVLEFVPSEPRLFAAALNGDPEPTVAATPQAETSPTPADPEPLTEAAPPRPLTMGLFYGLCVLTAALALWSLISMFL